MNNKVHISSVENNRVNFINSPEKKKEITLLTYFKFLSMQGTMKARVHPFRVYVGIS